MKTYRTRIHFEAVSHRPGVTRRVARTVAITILAITFSPWFRAGGAEVDKDGYPIFDPSEHSAAKVVDELYSSNHLRLRLGYYEEALAAATATAERFDGQLSPLDQARLDELVARCLTINKVSFGKAQSLFERANEVRSENGLHEEGEHHDDGDGSESLGSRFRLSLWAGECALNAGKLADAALRFDEALAASTGLFEGGFHEMLGTASRRSRNHPPFSLDAMGELDNSYWQFWNDAAIWSRILVGAWRTGLRDDQLQSAELIRRMDSLISSGLIEMETHVDNSAYREHTVGRGRLESLLDLVVVYAESRREQEAGAAIAQSVLNQLAGTQEDNFFVTPPARLLRLVIAHRGGITNEEGAWLASILRKAELWRETSVYPVIVETLVKGEAVEAAGQSVLFGKGLGTRRFERELGLARATASRGYSEYERAYRGWVESRLKFGYTYSKSVDLWDKAGDVLWRLTASADEVSEGRMRNSPIQYPDLDDATVAIEFVRLPDFRFEEGSGWRERGQVYVAFIFEKGERVTSVSLGDTQPIDNAVRDIHSTMMPGTRKAAERSEAASAAITDLSKRILQPLAEGSPAASHAQNWVIGTEGALEILPFFALDWSGQELGLVKELIHVTRVEGWKPQPEKSAGKAPRQVLLVGRPDYESSVQGASRPTGLSRSIDFGEEFIDLPGSGEEVTGLAAMFRAEGISCTVQMGKDASEPALLSALGRHSIIHLATHGFFLPADDTEVAHSNVSEADGLFRSAVALSGVNNTLREFQRGYYYPTDRDGILLAAEILPLDLRHVELATLSACQTGLGDFGEAGGVAGLAQGLALSGVKNMALSLWDVDDLAAKELMLEFYDRILKGEIPQRAMSETQRALFSRWESEKGWHQALRLAAPFRLISNPVRELPENPVVKWVIACEAKGSEVQARQSAARWNSRGFSSDVLWIPDYSSLSGAKLWLVYVGPFSDRESGRPVLQRVKAYYKNAYGIKVDQSGKRETF